MRVFNWLGILLYDALFGLVKLGFLLFKKSLDAIYGAPQIARSMPDAPVVKQAVPVFPRDFQPTVQLAVPIATAQADALPTAAKVTVEPSVQKAKPLANLAIADRVRTAQLYGPQGVVFGMMWLYLYPDLGIARRVFKVTDRHLIKLLDRDRFYFADVPYDPAMGYKVLLDKLHAECSVLLGKRRTDQREKRQSGVRTPRAAQAPAVVQASSPVRAVEPIPVPAPTAVPVAAAPPQAVEATQVAPAARRRVNGDEYKGIVTVAARTRRGSGTDSYETYCLTINDGAREIPLFGNELERQAADLKIKPGDKIKVIFMGKQQTTVPGSTRPSYKNLYQLTRMEGT